VKIIPKTSIGIAYAAIFIFIPKPAISHAQVVLPRFAPKRIPKAAINEIS